MATAEGAGEFIGRRPTGDLLRRRFAGLARRLYARVDREIIAASGLFEPDWYVRAYPDTGRGAIDPLTHYIRHGAAELRNPTPLFDARYYARQYPGLDPSTVNLLCHYILVGEKEGAWPNPYFDPVYFGERAGTSDYRGRTALAHFRDLPNGAIINPSALFDAVSYLRRNADVAEAGVNPLRHYLGSGWRETWRHGPPQLPAAIAAPRRSERWRIDRAPDLGAADDVLLFVAYCADGRLTGLQRRQIADWREAGYKVVLIINAGAFDEAVDPGPSNADAQIVRENIGFDFGGWRCAVSIIGGLHSVRSVTITNDSVLAVGGAPALAELRKLADLAEGDIAFATRNHEVAEHLQSYFVAFSRTALARGALSHIAETPFHDDKDKLIHDVEVKFSERLAADGFSPVPLFTLAAAELSKANPTIHHWEALLDEGFPFFKIQLLTAGIIERDDPRLEERLGAAQKAFLIEHLEARKGEARAAPDLNEPARRTSPAGGLFNEYGALMALNPPASQARAIRLPLAGLEAAAIEVPSILAVIHCFYLDAAAEILDDLAALTLPMRLLLTTDTEEKAVALSRFLDERRLQGRAVVVPNRGRDVAPFLIEGARDRGEEDVILHLHTKKSRHDERYAGWGEFLRKNLVGSRDSVLSILQMLKRDDVGIVYSEHYPEVAALRNWGYDFSKAKDILARLGVSIAADMPLDFPTSTMFWAKRSLIERYFALGLDYDDFDPEEGQIDGTLAHAIERTFLYLAEHEGLLHLKVVAEENESAAKARAIMKVSDLPYYLSRARGRLLGGRAPATRFTEAVGEIYPVASAPSKSARRRFNLILPTMKPEKIYGGITTAVAAARRLIDAAGGDVDVRALIVTDDVDAASANELASRLQRTMTIARPSDDAEGGGAIVDVSTERFTPLSLRRGDVFFATAWWTADLAFRLADAQGAAFGAHHKVLYLIQDFEPGFYNWGNHYALAEATYRRPEDTIALINSEELAGFFARRFEFTQRFVVPYALHPQLQGLLKPAVKEKILLCYGRPSVARNCFSILVEGVRLWQARDPDENCSWRVVFAGEAFDAGLLSELENASVAGKLPLEDYASLLARAGVGVSLMVSPHPSYPPLEMASAGAIVVTNRHEGKDLSARASNILSIDAVTPEAIAGALDKATARVKFGAPTPFPELAAPAAEAPEFDPAAISAAAWRRS